MNGCAADRVRSAGRAREVARRWVAAAAAGMPGFRGAFFHGSIAGKPDDAVLSAASDVDVIVVAEEAPAHKFVYDGVLLDVSCLAADEIATPEQILGRYDLAGSLRSPGVIADPAGRLMPLQEVVAREFARRAWVCRRCGDARDRVLRHLGRLNASDPLHDQVTAWLFASGVLTHVLLVAGLRNPTVRTRYVAVRELLAAFGYADVYERLLELLGCARIRPARVAHHLSALTEAFDAAGSVVKSPFPFAADLTEAARPIAIDGSRELIERGDHREAVFWIVATYSRCQKVFEHDGSEAQRERFTPGYQDLLLDLGITPQTDLSERGETVRDALLKAWGVAEAIIAANPGIEG